jgi:phthiocerol/phenolphthiocerol synthesis type-I polyketide synthase C
MKPHDTFSSSIGTNGNGRHAAGGSSPPTLVDLLRLRAREQPDRAAFRFLVDGEQQEVQLTYGELDHRARAIGRTLQEQGLAGERALLLFPSGLDYIAAFFGCLYAGVVAVPAYPPRLNRPTPRLQAIVANAQAVLVLSPANLRDGMQGRFRHTPGLDALRWLAVDEVPNDPADDWRHPGASGETIAFLQYTSGSTSTPRGVMLTHANLLYNSYLIHGCFEAKNNGLGVTWLPLYHDMGLIGGIIQTVYANQTAIVLSPVAFLQRPFRWLQAISRHRAAVSGGPNFAYELCIHKVTPEQIATLDLSCWKLAATGAEPVRKETLERFSEKFAACGFRPEAFYPCYGLAEATLKVSGAARDSLPVYCHLDGEALAQNRVRLADHDDRDAHVFVGCGTDLPGQQVRIVDPETQTICPSDRIGEIWVKGPSIAQGYWNRPEDSERVFRARLSDTSEGPFLRTGDLGFLKDGELFVTGRLKDLIIIRGRNYYPQDIEWTVEKSHPGLRPSCGAAFAIEAANEERLVVVQEVERAGPKVNVEEVAAAIRQAVSREHELEVHAVLLLRPGSVPKTSSGKIQRHACRQGYLAGTLEVVGQWLQPLENGHASNGIHVPAPADAGPAPTADIIQSWLVAQVAEYLHVRPEEVNVRQSFANFGLSSVQAVSLSGELEDWLRRRLSPTLVFEYPTIEELARHLAGEEKTAAVSTEADKVEQGEPIAIIGIGCRLPGARDPKSFWQLLRDGVDAISEVPPERWDLRDFYDPNPATPGKMSTRWGGFLQQIDQFDARFFGISPREAVRMDPQQRLLLEVAWEALEDAGLPVERLAGSRTGVFVGISSNDYGQMQFRDPALSDPYAGSGNALSIAANRLSYLFDLRGPSLAVDSACSSSLVAVHLACRSLWSGEATLALAGGVNLILSPTITVNFSKAGFMAPDGRCKAFDASANGYVRSEGAGVVVLKPLGRALADGDPVYAVIRGTAVNQDGHTNGLTAPNRHAQEAVLREAYRRAGVVPGAIQYVEAHGTGTALGDPIEASALGAVLGEGRPEGERCAIGSLKTNIGHLEAAAGIAGLIKMALALKHGELPPSLHFRQPNPHIPFDQLPLRVQTALSPWPVREGRALAGVSSFGFGGTNAHVVLEGLSPQADDRVTRWQGDKVTEDRETPLSLHGGSVSAANGLHVTGETSTLPPCHLVTLSPCHLIPLSARSSEALRSLASACRDALADGGPAAALPLRDVGYSASMRRSQHDHRLALTVQTHAEAVELLEAFLAGQNRLGLATGRRSASRRPRIVFVFSGQGPQWWGMGRQLLQQEPVFRATVEHCDKLLAQQANWSLIDELQAEETKSRLSETEVAQPVLFAIQVGLAALWRSWGVEPDAIVGHSLGEVAGAYVAGALTLSEAMRVSVLRGRLMQRVAGQGKTAAVELPEEEVRRVLAGYEDRLGLAAVNGPTSTTLSGDGAALDEVLRPLQQRNVFVRILAGNCAFHSVHMEPLRGELQEALADLQPQHPAVPFFSTVTGEPSNGHPLDAAYWGRNLRQTVLFARAVERLIESGHDVFLEIGPHPVLAGAINQCLRRRDAQGTVLPSLRRGEPERAALLRSLGSLWTLGVPVDWSWLYPQGRLVPLPTYPWQRERCWLDVQAAGDGRRSRRTASGHPLLDVHLQAAHPSKNELWEADIERTFPAYLDDHRLQGAVIFPGTGYVELALAASAEALAPGPRAVADIEFQRAMMLPENGVRRVQVVLTPHETGDATFHVFSRSAGGPVSLSSKEAWALHAIGRVRPDVGEAAAPLPVALAEVRSRCTEEMTGADYYRELRESGLEYGSRFQGIERLWRREGEALAQMRVPAEIEGELERHQLHPAVLDACLQVLGAAVPAEALTEGKAFLPVHMDRVRVYGRPGARYWSHARLSKSPADGTDVIEGDVRLLDESGRVLAEVNGFRLKRLDGEAQQTVAEKPEDWLYEVEWQAQELTQPTVSEQKSAGPWLLFLDRDGAGEALATELEARGESCIRVFAAERDEEVGPGRFQVRPGKADDLGRLLDATLGSAGPAACRGVVYFWALDAASAGQMSDAALEEAAVLSYDAVLHLVQALAGRAWVKPPRLCLVSRGANAIVIAGLEQAVSFAQAPLWGLGRVIALEHPEFGCLRIDLGPAAGSNEPGRVCEELLAGSREDQVAFRAGGRFVQRLVRRPIAADQVPADTAPRPTGGVLPMPGDEPFEVHIENKGIIDNLELRPMVRTEPGEGEVEIQVLAAGLNFRDVLNALGLYPGKAIRFGAECSGRVVRVGKGVTDVCIGDEVVALAPRCFASFVTVPAKFVMHKPANLTFEEAATVPITFLTAHYGLNYLARMSKGERVLIHAGAGGVGLAAIQLAQLAGAEVYATVGSPQKWAFLESLGVKHVFSSRSVDFADQVMELTDGKGVDIVLNSLAGEFIPKSLALLAPFGRFVEIGRIDIYRNSPVGLEPFKKNLSFYSVDLDLLCNERLPLARTLLQEILDHGTRGDLRPIPMTVFPIQEVAGAFHFMQKRKNIGKIVLSFSTEAPSGTGQSVTRHPALKADGTYLISGGLGGLGLTVADWMARHGAGHLVLLGRRGAAGAEEAVRSLQGRGARVVVKQADVADAGQMGRVLGEIDRELPPLRGIIHAAGVLDDGVLRQQTTERFRAVARPKVHGAWNLHRLTEGRPLDFFVCFSSAASVLGSPGQGNYAAANAFLDGLAQYRRAKGLPGLSINWGPWAEVGMAARQDRGKNLAQRGMQSLEPSQGLAVLDRLLRLDVAQVGAFRVSARQWRQFYQLAGERPLLEALAREGSTAEPAARGGAVRAAILAAEPERQQRLVEEYLAGILGFSADKLDMTQPLDQLGLDSLMAIELKNRVEVDLGVALTMGHFLQMPSMQGLANSILADLKPAEADGDMDKIDEVLQQLENLSEDEVKALLADETPGSQLVN